MRRRPSPPGWRPLPLGTDRPPRRVAESLDRITRSMGGPGPAALQAVFGSWEEVAGPAAAAHSRPVSIAKGTLVIDVDQPGWATSLRALSAQLLKRVEEVAGPGVAERIEVRVRPSP